MEEIVLRGWPIAFVLLVCELSHDDLALTEIDRGVPSLLLRLLGPHLVGMHRLPLKLPEEELSALV